MGLYDWAIYRTPVEARNIADSLPLFLISPIPYVVVKIIDGSMAV